MPLQNRVTALGEIVADPARGTFTGNRGIIHDPETQTLLRRRWTTRAWIVCALHFQERRRPVMARGTWTELFFLDEVTALAAGHRPCFYCRRHDAKRFAQAAFDSGTLDAPRAPAIDAMLHTQRVAVGHAPPMLAAAALGELPDGVAVQAAGQVYVLRDRALLAWSLRGYGLPRPLSAVAADAVAVITPALSVGALRAGYRPVWHPSARG